MKRLLMPLVSAAMTSYGDFKKRLFEALWEFFRPMRQRRAELAADPAAVDAVVKSAGERARSVAVRTMDRVRAAVGLRSENN